MTKGAITLPSTLESKVAPSNPADRPRDGDAPDDGPVDIAMPPVRCAGCCRRENFGDMYHGARLRRRSAEAQHDGRGCYPKCHAERPVYQLGEQPHEEEEQPGLVHAPPLQFVTGTNNHGERRNRPPPAAL